MKKLTELEVKKILKNKDAMIGNVHNRMHQIRLALHNGYEIMDVVRLPSPKVDDMPGRKGDYKGLEEVYIQYEEVLSMRNQEYKSLFRELIKEEERIHRVWEAFLALDEPYSSIINDLYVSKVKYKAVEQEYGLSHRVFEEARKEGIDKIIEMVESGKSISLLLLMKEKRKEEPKKESVKKDWEQITMSEFLGEEIQ